MSKTLRRPQAVRITSGAEPAGLRHGRDDGGGVVPSGAGLVVDEVDADLLAVLHRAVPATKGKTRRLATLGRLLKGQQARVVDEDGRIRPSGASA